MSLKIITLKFIGHIQGWDVISDISGTMLPLVYKNKRRKFEKTSKRAKTDSINFDKNPDFKSSSMSTFLPILIIICDIIE